jgi:hypothetical protein
VRLVKGLLIGCGVLVGLVAALAVWLYWRMSTGSDKSYRQLAARIQAVETRLAAGGDPDPAEVERFARDRATRRVLYDALQRREKLSLFPSRYRTQEAMAEADLVLWLLHPNELAAVPDAMELMASLPVPGPGFEGQRYHLFRFRTRPPHWAADKGWLAGVAGPYRDDGSLEKTAPGTWSELEPFDSRTPEDHVRSSHERIAGRR